MCDQALQLLKEFFFRTHTTALSAYHLCSTARLENILARQTKNDKCDRASSADVISSGQQCYIIKTKNLLFMGANVAARMRRVSNDSEAVCNESDLYGLTSTFGDNGGIKIPRTRIPRDTESHLLDQVLAHWMGVLSAALPRKAEKVGRHYDSELKIEHSKI